MRGKSGTQARKPAESAAGDEQAERGADDGEHGRLREAVHEHRRGATRRATSRTEISCLRRAARASSNAAMFVDAISSSTLDRAEHEP